MADYFEKIPEDKKRAILNACMKEFAKNGYTKASTNIMVKRAGVPKGTLFYFFSSKKEIYLYILEYAVNKFAEKLEEEKVNLPADIFDRLLQRGLIKLKMGREDPLLYQIVFDSYMNAPEELKEDI
ncbi:MAG: TetR/AcrR family transcriptional regulator, partial [Actinobacteria bacterium]|nr:TetR/AcrR family transcriptional regulator [Actinomycetota bacterium]